MPESAPPGILSSIAYSGPLSRSPHNFAYCSGPPISGSHLISGAAVTIATFAFAAPAWYETAATPTNTAVPSSIFIIVFVMDLSCG